MSQVASPFQPFSSRWMIRLLVVVVVLLAFYGGYYHVIAENWQRTYAPVLQKFQVKNTRELLQQEWERK